MEQAMAAGATQDDGERPMGPAMLRGWQRRCPCCGQGAALRGYLKVRDRCAVCATDLSQARADDGPAYVTILVVGKLVMSVYMTLYLAFEPEPWVMIAICWSLVIALSLWLLPRLKGAFVGLQWAKRMHGFDTGHGR